MRSILAGLRTLTLPWGAAPTAPRIVIGPDVPAALQTIWQSGVGANNMVGSGLPVNFPFTLVGAMLFHETFNGTDAYTYLGLVDGTNGVNHYAYMVIGSNAGDVYAAYAISHPVAGPNVVLSASTLSTTTIDVVNALQILTGAAWQIDGIDQPRGLVARTGSAAATVASVSSTAEITALTITNCLFRNGRAFAIRFSGFHASAAAQDVRYRAHTVTTAGQIVADFGDRPIVNATSAGEGFYGESLVRNASGADITHDVLLTMALQAGVTTANLVSRNSIPVEFAVWDIGTAAQFSTAKALT